MQELVAIRSRSLAEADAAFRAGWVPRALTMYEHLVTHAQAEGDRTLEAASRAMLARCLLRRRDQPGAEEQVSRARALVPSTTPELEGRLRATEVRLEARIDSGPRLHESLRTYYDWGSENLESAAFDAAMLMADHTERDERVDWYRRAIEHGRAVGISGRLGGACHALAATLETMDRLDEALQAYTGALNVHERLGDRRQVVASHWAVGAIAARLEDWLLAQEHLQAAVDTAADGMDCEDLLSLALADLAGVHEQWGDDIEARRLLLQSLAIAREIALAQRWPDRWDAMLKYAKRLEV